VPAQARVRILTKDGKWVTTPLVATPLAPGTHEVTWDGSKRIGRLLDGEYQAEIAVTDAVGTFSHAMPFASDTRRPTLRLVSLRPLRLSVSKPVDVVVVRNGQRIVVKRRAAGTFLVPGPAVRTLRVTAWDPAGNVSLPLRHPR
jgi:hypothetical protein